MEIATEIPQPTEIPDVDAQDRGGYPRLSGRSGARRHRRGADRRRRDGSDLEASSAALENLGRELESEGGSEELLVRSLPARYSTRGAIARATASAVELLGGMGFIGSPEVAYLYAATRVAVARS